MKSRTPLALGIAFIALVIVVVVALLSTAEVAHEVAAVDIDTPNVAVTRSDDSALVAPRSEEKQASTSAPNEDEERAAVATSADEDLADALWVEGIVQLPEGVPTNETIEVIASGRKFEHRELHRATIGSNGAFRVAFAKDTKTGYLKLDAEHLFLSKPYKLKLSELPPSIVLEPLVGARIQGVIVPPVGVEDGASVVHGQSVHTSGWSDGGSDSVQKSGAVDAALRFELRGIPTHFHLTLNADFEAWVPQSVGDLKLTPGEDRALELRFTQGASVSGRVVDESGAALSNVMLETNLRGSPSLGGTSRQAKVADDGTYTIRGIAPGELVLDAMKQGYLPAKIELGTLSDGDVKLEVEVRMPTGHFVAGHVTWPDGRAIAGAWVMVEQPEDDGDISAMTMSFMGGGTREKTEADGSFRVTGLGAGPYVVSAEAKPALEPESAPVEASSGAAVGKGPKKLVKKGAAWHARVENVATDSEALTVVLQPGFAVSGRVLDESALAPPRFTVNATKHEPGQWFPQQDGAVFQKFESVDGSFTLEGLQEGEYQLVASAPNFIESEALVITIPQQGAPPTLTVTHGTTLAGVVFDPSGKPAAGAAVEVDAERSKGTINFNSSDDSATADAQGRFMLKNQPSGSLKITASHAGFAPSAELVLPISAGASRDDLVLRLRRGGTLSGTVLAGKGGAPAGREVSMHRRTGGESHDATTDSGGRFTITDLAPGTYEVNVQPSDEVSADFKNADGDMNWSLYSALGESASVEIREGETTQLVIGAPPRAPVVISGVVTRGSKPVAGAALTAYGQGKNASRYQAAAVSGADGRYQMTVDEPGTYAINVNSSSGAGGGKHGTSNSRSVEIPETASFSLDFELSTGRIEGRVVGSDGAPLASVQVQLSVERSKAERRSGGIGGWFNTDDDGVFVFEDLPAGTYELTATHHSNWGGPSGAVELGGARRTGLELAEGGALTGIELRLEEAGAITGIVRDASGVPVVGARVTARDSEGNTQRMNTSSDGVGRYRVTNLAPGTWTVLAQSGTQVSAESAPVRVASKSEDQVDLVLREGTLLHVVVEDAEGKVVGASLSVRDERGRDQTRYSKDPRTSEAAPGWMIGPLASGTYTVTATNHDGVNATASVRVAGEAQHEVKLVLGAQ